MPTSITSTSSEAEHYFRETLEECDICLGIAEMRHNITKPQSIIIRELEKTLKENENFPHNVEAFISGLKRLCSNDDEFNKGLMPTEYHPSTETNSIEQESIFRIFLNIGCLQNHMIEMLLEYLTNLVCDESNDDTSVLRLILKALRFLPFINEPAQFTTKVLDLIEIANINTQRELLNHIPELIPDNQYDEAAKQLSKLLEDCDDLSGSIIDCVNSFNISADARFNIQEHIMERLLTSTRYYKIFPILFEFLLTDCKQEHIVNILLKTRDTIDNIMSAESSESVSYKALTFRKLECLANDEKYLFDGFINMIGTIKASTDHKPVDILVLYMLHSTSKGKKIVEAVFKKRIKNNLFKVILFERVFEKYFVEQIFDDYFGSVLEISGLLLKMHDSAAIEIAIVLYKLLFTHKYCSQAQRQDILYNLMMIIGMRDSKNTSVALKAMTGLLEANTIRNHAVQLMGLLEKVDVLNLNDVKQLFEILCTVACGQGSEELGFKDELHMFIRKQLSSYEKVVKQKGIISAVILAKHITSVEESIPLDHSETLENIENIPEGPAKEAAIILLSANQCALILPEMLGLYYDQLSSMIVSNQNFDSHFFLWLFDTITKDFQEMFLVDSTPEPINDIKLTAQYSLNADSEITEFLAVNIGEMAIRERYSGNSNIIILAPLFKLLRLLHYKQSDGDLSTIDALIGFPIIMPEYESIDDLHVDQIKQVADCVFHCINWFRELISAFCTQNLKRLRAKVIQRLKVLINLEETLQECMLNIPDHKLPNSCFDTITPLQTHGSPTKKDNRGIMNPKKKFKSAALVNETLPCTSASAASTAAPRSKRRPIKNELNLTFREMDTDIIVLLKYPLNISVSDTQTQSTTLNLKQFQFLLKDLIHKLDVLTSHKVSSLSHLNIVDPVCLLTDCQRFIRTIQKQTKAIVHVIEVLLESTDGRHDVAKMFTEEAEDLKASFALVLEFYFLIFRWPGFQQAKHQTLLKDCLKSAHETDITQTFVPTGKYITNFINDLTKSTEQCLLLSSAVRMIEIMQALYNIHAEPNVRKLIVSTSEIFLKRTWFKTKDKHETGKLVFIHIDVLVKAYLSDADVKTICGLVGTLQNEAPNIKSRDDYLKILSSIDKPSFHILYRGLCTALCDRVKTEVRALTNNEHLILWKITALTMQGLMTIVKVQNSKSNLSCFFKKSISILKIFLSNGIPILEIMLRSKPDRVLEILKILQTSTRFLHQLCCYSKDTKDSILVPLIPQFRLTLETLIYKVKAALIANNCPEAFWMGNLKNKDLRGEDILSQSTMTDSTAGDEELPLDDSDDDDDLIVNVNDQESTASEAFDLEV